ncbi:hypothetical protein BJY59DRAFT_475411 [Rhodotorula toruloides]
MPSCEAILCEESHAGSPFNRSRKAGRTVASLYASDESSHVSQKSEKPQLVPRAVDDLGEEESDLRFSRSHPLESLFDRLDGSRVVRTAHSTNSTRQRASDSRRRSLNRRPSTCSPALAALLAHPSASAQEQVTRTPPRPSQQPSLARRSLEKRWLRLSANRRFSRSRACRLRRVRLRRVFRRGGRLGMSRMRVEGSTDQRR